ncbi:putative oxidoreductase C-terminal domain-containing protein [Segetibacter koreensis]|uniref:putative oxidoreductase C-terminal domain-containing protein n=1 Tax=Segetibacter koreensis TaxID=398037 RepID=UPI0005265BA5|nr:putative oxidoreductase C-terminal domain-containing protein [Segetibacter koreensis]
MSISLASSQSLNSTGRKNLEDGAIVKLITIDPGHFHAALVQKEMYPGIDSVVNVYAPDGPELQAHLDLIKQYNERKENPTHWVEQVYKGDDYLDKMLTEKKGNVVIIAGNNRRKTEYIKKSIDAGINVLGDKPMAINYADFNTLQQSFVEAAKKKLLLYDIMTERSEITNILQKELSHLPGVFGELEKGTVNDPAVTLESVHYFYKYVSGKALTRPDWFFDPLQQGDVITDVGTHLIDLAQWECFPEQIIDYKKDIKILSSKTWTTPLTLSQYALITKENSFPGFLKQYVKDDTVLQTHANGEINYTLKNIHVKITARWDYKAEDGGDTHYSRLRGSKATLEIRQGKEDGFQPALYIIPTSQKQGSEYALELKRAVQKLNSTYPGVDLEKNAQGWKVIIPQKYKVGHEAHFGQVMLRYLQYLKEKRLPSWEVPNMISKYYTSTKALEMANK